MACVDKKMNKGTAISLLQPLKDLDDATIWGIDGTWYKGVADEFKAAVEMAIMAITKLEEE